MRQTNHAARLSRPQGSCPRVAAWRACRLRLTPQGASSRSRCPTPDSHLTIHLSGTCTSMVSVPMGSPPSPSSEALGARSCLKVRSFGLVHQSNNPRHRLTQLNNAEGDNPRNGLTHPNKARNDNPRHRLAHLKKKPKATTQDTDSHTSERPKAKTENTDSHATTSRAWQPKTQTHTP